VHRAVERLDQVLVGARTVVVGHGGRERTPDRTILAHHVPADVRLASLPHSFRDPSLLALALTHASTGEARDNERLEFLGDAVLDLLVAEELYQDPRHLAEGRMTELKARVVSREALAVAAHRLELEPDIRVGPGLEGRSLPRSLLANVYEAVLGAIYLDAGLEAARAFVRTTLGEALAALHEPHPSPNPKQELQHLCQRHYGSPPDYVQIEARGQSHARAFLVSAEVDGRRFPSAWGRTLKEAERWAAFEALLVFSLEADAGGDPAPGQRA
jgi:ribonuclease-3